MSEIDRQPHEITDEYVAEGVPPDVASGISAADVAARSYPAGEPVPTSVIDTNGIVQRRVVRQGGMHRLELHLGRGVERRVGGDDE